MESITVFKPPAGGPCTYQPPASLSWFSRLSQPSGREEPSPSFSWESSHPSHCYAIGAAVACGLGFRQRVRRRCKLEEAEALQKAWLFDAALDLVNENAQNAPRAKALKAAALVGLARFSEARQVLDEIDWNDVLVATETGINPMEFCQRCEVLERQNLETISEDLENRFLFSEIFAPLLRAHESGRDPAMPMTPTAALLPPVPEVASRIEVRSSSAGSRGLFVTEDLSGGDVVLCGLPLARCVNSGEPLVPALQKAAGSSPRVRRVLSLLSDGNEAPEVSLKDFSWTSEKVENHMPHEDQLAKIIQINSFDLFGSSALFGATSMANHSCCPSASSMAVGNAIFVRANRPLPLGRELQISYFDVLKPYQQRQERTQSWSFQCECPRCSFERNLPSHLQEIGESVDVIESAAGGFSSIEAQWLRASHLATYMKELEDLFPLSKEADQRRKAMLQAMETTDPASFTHIKLSFLDWLATKSLKGSKDPKTLQAMQYCDRIHQRRYGKIPGPELVSLMKCTQQATQSSGVGEEFCNPWAVEIPKSQATGTTNTATAMALLD